MTQHWDGPVILVRKGVAQVLLHYARGPGRTQNKLLCCNRCRWPPCAAAWHAPPELKRMPCPALPCFAPCCVICPALPCPALCAACCNRHGGGCARQKLVLRYIVSGRITQAGRRVMEQGVYDFLYRQGATNIKINSVLESSYR